MSETSTKTVRTPFGIVINENMITKLNAAKQKTAEEQKLQKPIVTPAGPVAQSKVHPDPPQDDFGEFLFYINCLNKNKPLDGLKEKYTNSLNPSSTTLLSRFANFFKRTSADKSSCDSP